jgi:large subunit ribosomal protein L6
MSKIGRTPIIFKNEIQVILEASTVIVTTAKGEFKYTIPSGISAKLEEGKLTLSLANLNDRSERAIYGLTRANIANGIKGLDTGFEKKLEIQGVGYRAQIQGEELVLSLGFSHPVNFTPDKKVKITVDENIITITGVDKALVGETAAKIRALKPPEPYKGKGIRYKGEIIKKKVGKAAKAIGTK